MLIVFFSWTHQLMWFGQHFYAEPRAAKEKLGWKSSTNLPEDLKERFEEYVAIGRDKKDIKFELDDKILELLKSPVTTSV